MNTSISTEPAASTEKVNLASYLTMLTIYTVGIPIAVLLLITTFMFAFAMCNRTTANNTSGTGTATVDVESHENNEAVTVIGIDDDTLKAFPTVVYARNISSNDGCCSICLVEYKEGEVLRVMPGCSHLFHVQCVDVWLKSRPTCPVCRTSPLTSPVPTPLAEVVPLAQTVQRS